MESLILIAKGFLIGIANIIPGVSGGTLMITLGIYERVIDTISHFFKKWKENLKFLIPLAIGMVLSLLLLSKVIGYCLDNYPFPTTIFFIGLILGGIPLLCKKVKGEGKKVSNWIIFAITFAIIAVMAFLKSGDQVVNLEQVNLGGIMLLFLVGMVASSTMIIPGISGSFMLMLLGYYKPIINTIRSLTKISSWSHSLVILIPFGLGAVIGIVLVAKLIEYLLKKCETKTYFGVLGFVLASIVAIVLPLVGLSINPIQIVISILVFILGFGIAYKLGGTE